MANMRLDKNPMPIQDAEIRNKNFSEVALGYTTEQAIDEAKRCLNCKISPALAVALLKSIYLRHYCEVFFSTCYLWTCLPSRKPVRRQMRTRHKG